MTGQSIGHYQILEKLGEGGMGVVYKARDTHLDRFVAIKVLPAEKVANSERKRRFVQEAKSASALNHPNIVTIHDITEEDGVDFMVMEYVAGKTLDELIPRKGMRLNEALKIAVQVADALTTAHEAGIVHRDLKPGNIIVGDDGRVRVLDFGLAKLTEAVPESEETRTVVAGDAPHTEEGTILGTVSYMSPEQAEGRTVDARSDIFSFGSVFYEMVTGQRAFRGDSSMSTLGAIIHKEPEALPAEVPHDLHKVVSRCLRKDPSRRFQHMDDVKIALEELKEESDSGTLTKVVPVSARAPRWTGAAVLVIVLAVLSAAGWFWFGRPDVAGRATAFTPVPLTSYPGVEWSPSFSPDGNQVAFSWDGESQDNTDIYVKLIGSPTPLRLTTDPADDVSPAWSPDGRSIAFLRLGSEKASVILIPAIGGPQRVVTEVGPQAFKLVNDRALSWSPDGQWLVCPDRDSPSEPLALSITSVATGEKRELTSPEPDILGDDNPAVSPDGRAIAFVRSPSWSAGDLYVLELTEDMRSAGDPKRLTSENRIYTSGPAWTSDGREIVFASADGLWRVSASGSDNPEQLPTAGGGDVGARNLASGAASGVRAGLARHQHLAPTVAKSGRRRRHGNANPLLDQARLSPKLFSRRKAGGI